MKRRDVLLGILAGSVVVGSGGALWLNSESNHTHLSIDETLKALDNLVEQNPKTMGDWNLHKIFSHCAQSVEFSMTGFPEHKPDIFKQSVGSLAFAVFSKKGEMRHGLNETIPSAPEITNDNDDYQKAYLRFKESMIKFQNYSGPLAEHFAYGKLNKKQYEKAHAMHFYNHLLEIESKKVS